MKVNFSPSQQETPDREGGMKIPYAPAKRAIPKWKWRLLVLLLSTPLLFLIWRVASAVFFVTAPGIISLEKVSVNAPLPATVARIEAQPGTSVASGDVLLRLDDPALEQRRILLSAEMEGLREGVPSVTVQMPPPLVSSVSRDQIRLAQQNVEYQRAYRNTVRTLFEQGAATRAEVDAAQDRYRQAELTLVSLRASLTPAPQPIVQGPSYYELESEAQRRNRIRQIEAELKLLDTRSVQLTIRSPENARILDVFPSEGEILPSGAPLVLLGRPQSVQVVAYLQPRHLGYAQPGKPVTVRFSNGTSMGGKVSSVPELAVRIPAELSGVLDEGKQMLLVKVAFDEPLPDILRVEGLPLSVSFGFSIRQSLSLFEHE